MAAPIVWSHANLINVLRTSSVFFSSVFFLGLFSFGPVTGAGFDPGKAASSQSCQKQLIGTFTMV
jgi:hypothetical protein